MTVQKEITCHQSGVTCIDYSNGYIFTGGEDGNICVLNNGEVVETVKKAHNAQVSGISVISMNTKNPENTKNIENLANLGFLIISTSLDQRVNGFIMKNEEIEHVFCHKTAVADLTGFDTVVNGSEILVALAGQGLELIRIESASIFDGMDDGLMVDSI